MAKNNYYQEYKKRKKGVCYVCKTILTEEQLRFTKTVCSKCLHRIAIKSHKPKQDYMRPHIHKVLSNNYRLTARQISDILKDKGVHSNIQSMRVILNNMKNEGKLSNEYKKGYKLINGAINDEKMLYL